MRRVAYLFVTPLAILSGALVAAAYRAGGAAFALPVAGIVALEVFVLCAVCVLVNRRAQRRKMTAEFRRRQRLKPLPTEWDVPDTIPANLDIRDL